MRYSEVVIDHFEHPRNSGALAPVPGRVVSGAAGRVETGARVEIDLALDGSTVSDVRFRAFGCPHLIAAASRVTERVIGLEVVRLTELRPVMMAEELSLPPAKLGLMLILEDALHAAARAAAALDDSHVHGHKHGN